MPPSSQLFSQYQTFQQKRSKPEDYVKKYTSELGVDQAKERVKSARTAIRSTEDTISGIPDSVAGRTSGSLVTDSQRNRLVQNEVAPLQDVLRTQNAGYGDATSDFNTLNSDLERRVGLALQGDDTQANTLLQLFQAASDAEKQAEAVRQFNAQMAEQQRQFNESQRTARAAAAASSYTPTFGGNTSASGNNLPSAPSAKTQADYNYVRNLINEVKGGNGNTAKLVINQAKSGNQRSIAIMRAFYQLQGRQVPKSFQSFLGTV